MGNIISGALILRPLTLNNQHLELGSEGGNALPVVLRHAERTGDATVLYTALRGSSELLTCRVPGSFTGAPQKPLLLQVDEADFHVFDQQGNALPRRAVARWIQVRAGYRIAADSFVHD